jgi:hypothetical protein
MSTDRNHVFGLLALLNDFVTRGQLLDALDAWEADNQAPLSEVLCRRGALDEQDRRALDVLVDRHIRRHGDPQASLAALRGKPPVREDAEVQASLAPLGPDDLRMVARVEAPVPTMRALSAATTWAVCCMTWASPRRR